MAKQRQDIMRRTTPTKSSSTGTKTSGGKTYLPLSTSDSNVSRLDSNGDSFDEGDFTNCDSKRLLHAKFNKFSITNLQSPSTTIDSSIIPLKSGSNHYNTPRLNHPESIPLTALMAKTNTLSRRFLYESV